ncbi:MAG: hypothetical protein WAO98_03875 [Alphaproteobacteria bacterium]
MPDSGSMEFETASAQPVASPLPPEPFKPTPYEQFLGFFSGANFSDHYTHQDVKDINFYGYWTMVSVSMAATGIALALQKYAGVPFVVSFFPAAAAYTCMDRAIIRAESLSKADRILDKMLDPFAIKDEKGNITAGVVSGMRSGASRIIPLSFRLSMAACTSLITGGVIIERIAEKEIAAMIDQSFQENNKGLIERKDRKEQAYDQRISSLQARITVLRSGMTQYDPPIITIRRTPADQARFDAATQEAAVINSQIATAEKQLITDQNKMKAEEKGAALPGTSGLAGKSKRWEAAKILVEGDQRLLSQLRSRLQEQQRILNDIAQQDRRMLSAGQARADASSQNIASARQSELAVSTTELAQLTAGRNQAFAGFKRELETDPLYKSKENDTGIFADMMHLETFLQNPKTGIVAAGFMRTIELLIFLAEMSAVLGAMLRSPTKSEMRDAKLRAGALGQIEREVMAELEEIIPMRKRLLAMAATAWEKMGAFYRPEEGPQRPGKAGPERPGASAGYAPQG